MRWRIVRRLSGALAFCVVIGGLLCFAALGAAIMTPVVCVAACGYMFHLLTRRKPEATAAPAPPPSEIIRGDVIVFLDDGPRSRAFANASEAAFFRHDDPKHGPTLTYLDGNLSIPFKEAEDMLDRAYNPDKLTPVYVGFPDGRKVHGGLRMILMLSNEDQVLGGTQYPCRIEKLIIRITRDEQCADTQRGQLFPKKQAGQI